MEPQIQLPAVPEPGEPPRMDEILPKFSSQLKTDFENRNLWLRFGLSIARSRESPQSALQAFNECMRIDQDDPLPAMLAARISLEELDDPEKALELTDEAISRCKKQLVRNPPVNITNGIIDSLDNSSIEMICSSVSSSSTSNHSSSQSTIVQAPDGQQKPQQTPQSVKLAAPTTDNGTIEGDHVEQDLGQASKKDIKITTYKNIAPLLSRCYVMASVAHAYLYEREPESIRQLFREKNLKTSLELLDSALETNSLDHLVYFHKALHEAKQRNYPKAIDNLRRAIQINPHHIPSIQLLIIALSALKLYDEALNLCESILNEHEDNLMLLYIKCNLEQCLVETKGYKVALKTAQHMLKCIRRAAARSFQQKQRQQQQQLQQANGHTKNYSSATTISVTNQSTTHQGSVANGQTLTASHATINNTSTLTANSGTATNSNTLPFGTTLAINSSSGASANNASTNNVNVPASLLNTAGEAKPMGNLFGDEALSGDPSKRRDFLSGGELTIWVLVAEIFVKIGSVEDAEMCVEEGANQLNGALSYQLLYIQGLIAKAKGQHLEAKEFFQSSLALCPKNSKTLQQIAHVHYLLGNHTTAEKFLKDSLDLESDCSKTWFYLSLVYIELNQHERANECVKKSTTLEESSPSVPFYAISRLTLQ